MSTSSILTAIQIIDLGRLAITAFANAGLDIAELKQRMEANGGELSQEDTDEYLQRSQEAIDRL
tara:strand:+ start:27113 stop:27304 length:192 start_codon:yes stop_codon:yes gene_type:complete